MPEWQADQASAHFEDIIGAAAAGADFFHDPGAGPALLCHAGADSPIPGLPGACPDR